MHLIVSLPDLCWLLLTRQVFKEAAVFHLHNLLSQRIVVVSPMSCFANNLFASVLGRRQRPSVLTKNKAAYWCLECNPGPWVVLGSRNFKSLPVSIERLWINLHVLIVSQPGSWAPIAVIFTVKIDGLIPKSDDFQKPCSYTL